MTGIYKNVYCFSMRASRYTIEIDTEAGTATVRHGVGSYVFDLIDFNSMEALFAAIGEVFDVAPYSKYPL